MKLANARIYKPTKTQKQTQNKSEQRRVDREVVDGEGRVDGGEVERK